MCEHRPRGDAADPKEGVKLDWSLLLTLYADQSQSGLFDHAIRIPQRQIGTLLP